MSWVLKENFLPPLGSVQPKILQVRRRKPDPRKKRKNNGRILGTRRDGKKTGEFCETNTAFLHSCKILPFFRRVRFHKYSHSSSRRVWFSPQETSAVLWRYPSWGRKYLSEGARENIGYEMLQHCYFAYLTYSNFTCSVLCVDVRRLSVIKGTD